MTGDTDPMVEAFGYGEVELRFAVIRAKLHGIDPVTGWDIDKAISEYNKAKEDAK